MKLSHDFLLLFCQQNIALLESVRKDLRLNYRQKNSLHQENFFKVLMRLTSAP